MALAPQRAAIRTAPLESTAWHIQGCPTAHRAPAALSWHRGPLARMLAIDAKAVGVAEYAHTWIEQRNLKPRTRSGDHDLLRLPIGPMLGKVPLKNLTRETVRGWVFDAGHRSLTA